MVSDEKGNGKQDRTLPHGTSLASDSHSLTAVPFRWLLSHSTSSILRT